MTTPAEGRRTPAGEAGSGPVMQRAPPVTAREDRNPAYVALFVAFVAGVVFASLLGLSLRASDVALTAFLLRWGWLLLVAVLAGIYGVRRFRS